MELTMNLSQRLIMSQRLIQSNEILQMNTQELDEYIEKLSLENPVIELQEFTQSEENTRQNLELQRKMDWLSSTDLQNRVYYNQEYSSENSEDNWHNSQDTGVNLSDYLLSQIILNEYTKQEREIIEFLIHSLDYNGYFKESFFSVAEYFSVNVELVEKLLKDVQSLDPAGVGARSLKECLLLQLDRSCNPSPLVRTLIVNHLNDIAKNHISGISYKLKVPVEDIQEACQTIKAFNPRPSNCFSNRELMQYIKPDAVVVKFNNEFKILVNEYSYSKFSINSYYKELFEITSDEETKRYLNEKLQQAKWVTECISQRTSTLSRLMKVIVERQNDFFIYGTGHLHPLKLSDLTEELDLHESTISRAMRGKYLQCSWGIFPLNYFLSSSINQASDSSNYNTPERAKLLLKKVIQEENRNKPYSDQELSQKLEEYDIKISRRTVNKYRTELGIPDKSGRKHFDI